MRAPDPGDVQHWALISLEDAVPPGTFDTWGSEGSRLRGGKDGGPVVAVHPTDLPPAPSPLPVSRGFFQESISLAVLSVSSEETAPEIDAMGSPRSMFPGWGLIGAAAASPQQRWI